MKNPQPSSSSSSSSRLLQSPSSRISPTTLLFLLVIMWNMSTMRGLVTRVTVHHRGVVSLSSSTRLGAVMAWSRPARRTLKIRATSASSSNAVRREQGSTRDAMLTELSSVGNDSWMAKNERFPAEEPTNDTNDNNNDNNNNDRDNNNGDNFRQVKEKNDEDRTFRDNFRETRVFVQGIPDHISWQDLKDHFRLAGNVVFASVSVDRETKRSKGHGIVQFETVAEASHAIQIMREHPMDDGSVLYVRPDHQEASGEKTLRPSSSNSRSSSSRPNQDTWRCANDGTDLLNDEERAQVVTMVEARDAARRRRNYAASDAMREDLKVRHGVHLDDRLKLWWKQEGGFSTSSTTNPPPQSLQDLKGPGHWNRSIPDAWRRIPSATADLDACVDPRLVEALLAQRDVARREKDFGTADALLRQAVEAPDTDGLTVRVHDASRTWRVWSDTPPQRSVTRSSTSTTTTSSGSSDPAQRCLDLVAKHDPSKREEVQKLLASFPGREYNILKKLKQRYGIASERA